MGAGTGAVSPELPEEEDADGVAAALSKMMEKSDDELFKKAVKPGGLC